MPCPVYGIECEDEEPKMWTLEISGYLGEEDETGLRRQKMEDFRDEDGEQVLIFVELRSTWYSMFWMVFQDYE